MFPKSGQFIDQLSNLLLLKKDSTPTVTYRIRSPWRVNYLPWLFISNFHAVLRFTFVLVTYMQSQPLLQEI